jgi:hypothetical protein
VFLELLNNYFKLFLFIFKGIKDFYDRLTETETEMLLNASRQFSGQVKTDGVISEVTNGDEEEEDAN